MKPSLPPSKGRRGRRMRRRTWWLFGATEHGTNHSFLGLCVRRTAAVLITMIRRHIRPGTTIMTDGWRTYSARLNGIQAQRLYFYRHFVVNHVYHFVNTVNRQVHTQTIEGKWQRWHAHARRKYDIHDKQYDRHIAIFNWRKRFGRTNEIFGVKSPSSIHVTHDIAVIGLLIPTALFRATESEGCFS
uniref:ISXO2-like transposase domain-containing protein n=1 Tax=Acrobeloides nanus TaxID=290746 RepID=A0A914DGC6_9BILA